MVESGSLLRSYGVKPIEGSNPSLSVIEPVGSLYQFSGNLVSELPQLSYAIVGASKPKPRSPTTALRTVLFVFEASHFTGVCFLLQAIARLTFPP